MRKIRFFILCVLLCIFCVSCGKVEGLTVYSNDYHITENLYESELDIRNPIYWDADSPYDDFSCMIEEIDGEIWISNRGIDKHQWFLPMNYGYIVGINHGIQDGWVRYYKNQSTISNTTPIDIALQNCVYCLETSHREWLVLTNNIVADSDTPKGTLFACEDGADGLEVRELCYFDEHPQFVYMLENGVYLIFTENSVVSFNPEKSESIELMYSKKLADGNSLLFYMDINSCIQKGSMVYCGTSIGIYAIDLDDCSEHFFPLDYSAISSR